MRKPKFYFNETYKMNYYFCIGWTDKEIIRYMQKHWNHTIDNIENAKGKTFECHKGSNIVIVIWSRKKLDYPTIVHECVHAANMNLNYINWKPDLDNDEPQAYLTENIFNKAIGK